MSNYINHRGTRVPFSLSGFARRRHRTPLCVLERVEQSGAESESESNDYDRVKVRESNEWGREWE